MLMDKMNPIHVLELPRLTASVTVMASKERIVLLFNYRGDPGELVSNQEAIERWSHSVMNLYRDDSRPVDLRFKDPRSPGGDIEGRLIK
jgi:hypothetical protein